MKDNIFSITIEPHALKALQRFVSTDETRFVLCGISVEWDRKTLTLIATDGRKMAIYTPDWSVYGIEGQDTKFIIPSTFIDRLLESDHQYTGATLEYNPADKEIELKFPDFAVKTTAVDGHYPHWRPIVPDPMPETFVPIYALLNVDFLHATAALIEELDAMEGMKIVCAAKNSPLVFISRKLTTILMPLQEREA